MVPSGFAVGSNLSDLGRNLIAQETTRNALQAALSAAAAQQGVARTQAGASRYSTDAQRQGNELNAMMRGLEQDRLREATGIEARLRERGFANDAARDKAQFAPNTPEERALDRAARIREAEIVGEAQRAYYNRPDSRVAEAQYLGDLEIEKIAKALPGLEANANLTSEALFNARHDWKTGKTREIADYQKAALAITGSPGYEEFGSYLMPSVDPDGRVRFKAQIPTRRLAPTPHPLPPSRSGAIDEVEYGLEGMGSVPRGTPGQMVVPQLPPPTAFPVDRAVPQSRASVMGGFNLAELARRLGQASAQDPSALSETAEAALRQRVSGLMLEIRQPTTPPDRKAQIIQELERIRSLKPQ